MGYYILITFIIITIGLSLLPSILIFSSILIYIWNNIKLKLINNGYYKTTSKEYQRILNLLDSTDESEIEKLKNDFHFLTNEMGHLRTYIDSTVQVVRRNTNKIDEIEELLIIHDDALKHTKKELKNLEIGIDGLKERQNLIMSI
jgi:peptidoglycan hydrolase CwlO-like protein